MLKLQNPQGQTIAYLNNLENGTMREVINGEYLISFVALVEPLKTEFLYDNSNLIEHNNDLFRVVEIQELHTEENALTVAVTAEHISYDLIKNVMPNFNYINQSAAYVMIKALEGTEFSFTGTDITTFNTSIQYTEECNSKQITTAIANNWRGELQYFRRDIQLLKQRGTNRGVDFRFGKNTLNIKRIINFADGTVAYEVTVVTNSETEELGAYGLGDTVRVIDSALKIDTEIRITELEKDLVTGLNTTVILGDKIKDLRSSFASTDKKIAEATEKVNEVAEVVGNSAEKWNRIEHVTDNQGNLIAGLLVGMINTANAMIQNGTGTMTWTGNTLMIHDQPTEAASTFAIELGAQGMRIANSKNVFGGWVWRTAIGADGLVADKVYASAIAGLTIDSVTLTSTEIISGLITGVTINGATIIGGNSDGMHTIISPTNPFQIRRGNNITAEIWGGTNGSASWARFYAQYSASNKLALEINASGMSPSINIPDSEFTIDVKGSEFGTGYQFGRVNIRSENGVRIFNTGVSSQSGMEISKNGTTMLGYNGRYTDIFGDTKIYSNLEVTGDLIVSGEVNKNAVVATENYGHRKLYCEESDRVYFNTKGIDETGANNKCFIRINDIFLQTIEPNSVCPYIINLTPYSNAHIWVSGVYDKYVVVESDKPTRFAYNLQCTRKNRKEVWLEEFDKEARRIAKREVV
jgi:hypothetical protein